MFDRRLLMAIAVTMAASVSGAAEIPLQVLEPERRDAAVKDFPVSVGMVFPDGELDSVPGGALKDGEGRPVPFEAEATGWWDPDRTRIKWLLLHFRANTESRYTFVTGGAPVRPRGASMVSRDGDALTVDTGPLKATFRQGSGKLFDAVALRGTPMLEEKGADQVLAITYREHVTTVRDWRIEVEASTPGRVALRGQGFFEISWAESVAKIDVRYEFYRGESFVRVYHTLTWMQRNPKLGIQEFAVALRPALGEQGVMRLGLSDPATESAPTPWDTKADLYAYQDQADGFTFLSGKEVLREGQRLGGWASMESADGRGVGVALRHAWQTYPTAFACRDGALRVEFWPTRSGPSGFTPEDIIPPDMFNDSSYWNRFRWVKKKGHFVHEYSGHPHFVYTPEGTARTHELTVFFYDKSSRRSTAELNSVTQHPIVIRQDPRSAMRVPFMGFDIEPVRKDYPDMERAIEQIGRMSVGRWVKTHDYGLWRFGMVRWAGTGVSYRWMDGHQYDITLIPWLLFLRGGDRRFYEEGEATARFAMDVATNHFNTRGLPTGYQAAASATPFPWHETFLSKAPKVHFLAYYYHLTGYRRAKDVMDEVIAGNKAAAVEEFKRRTPEHQGGHGREMYNMNVFWVNAYRETFDPEVKKYARAWLDFTIRREYNPKLNVFRQPNIYLYPGLVLQYGLWDGKELESIMLRNLKGMGYPDLPKGGVYRAEDSPGCGWAYRRTQDKRFVEVGWDIARTLADLVPDHDWTSNEAPDYPINGNQFYRHFLLPIIVGYSNAARLGMPQKKPFEMRDTFVSLPRTRQGEIDGVFYVRAKRDGDLRVRLIAKGTWGRGLGPLKATALSADGKRLDEETVPAATPVKRMNRFFPIAESFSQQAELNIPDAKMGVAYRVRVTGRDKDEALILPLADADIVQRVDAGNRVHFYNLAGQYYVGTRVFTRAIEDAITVTNPYVQPFTIRDADTGEALARFNMADPKRSTFRVGKGRMLRITMTGRRDWRQFKGVSPWFARTREQWFEPE